VLQEKIKKDSQGVEVKELGSGVGGVVLQSIKYILGGQVKMK
jgi:hypothetical protein